jgi:predicted acetyltransferase
VNRSSAAARRRTQSGGLLELTEFFVLPASQCAGVGRALLERAFPLGRGETRSIIATMDVRALSRYFRAGTVARFPMLSLAGAPSATEMNSDLTPQPVDAGSVDDRRDLAAIDGSVLEYAREEAEIRWLLETREGHLYRRDGQSVGFAFVGKSGAGPAAVLDATDLPAILLHVESRAVAAGIEQLEFQVPSPNDVATRHLLSRGFRLDPWINLLLSSRPFGHFDRLVCFGPPLFL